MTQFFKRWRVEKGLVKTDCSPLEKRSRIRWALKIDGDQTKQLVQCREQWRVRYNLVISVFLPVACCYMCQWGLIYILDCC